jgi:predicted MFS family arabinose efflux permease
LQVIANLIVGFAQSYVILLSGRVILGLGGFWSLCVATVMHLVPATSLPKALSIVFGAVSVATVIAAPDYTARIMTGAATGGYFMTVLVVKSIMWQE